MKRTRRKLTPEEREAAGRFHQSADGKTCLLCPRSATDAHHVIEAQHLRRENLPVYAPENAAPLCRGCHMNVTVRMLHIPRSLLSAANEGFAREHGLGWYLDRNYGRTAVVSTIERSRDA